MSDTYELERDLECADLGCCEELYKKITSLLEVAKAKHPDLRKFRLPQWLPDPHGDCEGINSAEMERPIFGEILEAIGDLPPPYKE